MMRVSLSTKTTATFKSSVSAVEKAAQTAQRKLDLFEKHQTKNKGGVLGGLTGLVDGIRSKVGGTHASNPVFLLHA
jgi:hypothetical protein